MSENTIEPTPEGVPAGTSSTSNEPIRLSLLDQKKAEWTLELHPQHLSLFSDANPQPWVFPRGIVVEKMDFLPAARTLVLKAPQKSTLRMSKESAKALAEWMGPAGLAGLMKGVKAANSWSGTMGLLFLAGSFPRYIHGVDGASWAGLKPVQMCAGILLIAIWLLGRAKPHRVIVLLDAVLFLGLAVVPVVRVTQGAAWWLLIVACVNGLIAFMAFMTYQNLAYFNLNQPATQK